MASAGQELLGEHYGEDQLTYEQIEGLGLRVVSTPAAWLARMSCTPRRGRRGCWTSYTCGAETSCSAARMPESGAYPRSLTTSWPMVETRTPGTIH
jgi:hypothetical protein